MMAARNTKPPKAPRAMMAPRLSLAPKASRRSPSTDRGMFTLGTSPCWMLELPAISLSCGWPATMMWGGVELLEVRLGIVGLIVLVASLDMSVTARMVVGDGLGGRVRVREVVGLDDVLETEGAAVVETKSSTVD
jgi:hypothetical protein